MLKRIILLALLLSLQFACQSEPDYQSRAEEVFPPVAIKRAALFRLGKPGISPAFFKGQWTGVLFVTADCTAPCQQRMALANQADSNGVRFVAVVIDLADHRQLNSLQAQFSRVEIGMGTTAASIDNFRDQFADDALEEEEIMASIFFVNEDAELVYRVPAYDLQPGDLDRELRLLTES